MICSLPSLLPQYMGTRFLGDEASIAPKWLQGRVVEDFTPSAFYNIGLVLPQPQCRGFHDTQF